jgi:Ni/Fe-hydrogenase subunit HybB-like protein
MQRFKPVAHFALLTSLCLMIFVPSPLLLHLGHPERAFNPVITPHWSSAMAMFGYFAGFYIILLVLENWFVFRPHIVRQAQQRKGLLGWFYRVLSLGSYDLSENAMRYDRKWIFALAVTGIPAAHGLHGYVGFIFGSLKSREWWSSDLMPVIFLLSAIISGTSLLVVLYYVSCKLRRVPVDVDCMKGMAYTLWGFVMFTFLLELVEFGSLTYKAREGIEVIWAFITGPFVVPYFVLQFAIGAVIPIVWLSYMFWRRTTGNALIFGITVSALLVLFEVLMMRFNVVIGGQEISKTGKGLLTVPWVFLGREGVFAAAAVLVAPFVLLLVMIRLFPPWEDSRKALSH